MEGEKGGEEKTANSVPGEILAPRMERVDATGVSGGFAIASDAMGVTLSNPATPLAGDNIDGQDSDQGKPGRQHPIWKQRYQNGAGSRGEWQRKTVEASAQALAAENSALKDTLQELKAQKSEEEAAQRERDAARERDEAYDAYKGRKFSFAEKISVHVPELLARSVALILTGITGFYLQAGATYAGRPATQGIADVGSWLALFLTMWAAIIISAVALFRGIEKGLYLVGAMFQWKVEHRYRVCAVDRDTTVDPFRRPLAMQLTKCEYTSPLLAIISHQRCTIWYFLPHQIKLPFFGKLSFVWHRSKMTMLSVSLEVLSQMIVPKNTATESDDKTLANSLTASLKALHAVAVDKTSNAVSNVLEETKLAAFGLIKSHKERTHRVPFPRAAN